MLAELDVGPQQVSDGFRERGRRISQPNGDGGPIVEDVVDREADDAGDGLCVEKD
ncbi:hypothetical protein GCM10010278_86360 [Streptomyces melanogenes]|nr:hypothetical protein GCM10010278_86360 [Streptomyces melanogenes]